MGKATTIYKCTKCDAQSPKWAGRCFECGAWGTLEGKSGERGKGKGLVPLSMSPAGKVMTFDELTGHQLQRIVMPAAPAGVVFPTGVPQGSLTLIAGAPGAGKSTLALQLALQYAASQTVVYFSAEESGGQVKEKIERLGSPTKGFLFSGENDVDTIIATIAQRKASVAVVDSIQTIASGEVEGERGSIGQLKACTGKLLEAAKMLNVAIFIIGHVTKEGLAAGPKTLEHLVDVVLYIEGEPDGQLRIVRSTKNRYGSTGRISVFRMTKQGLLHVPQPATAFIANFRPQPGSVVGAVVESGQVFFVEVQSLVTKSNFGYAKRAAQGFPVKRLEVLLAVVKKRLKFNFDSYDVYVNLVGGFQQKDPSLDLAVVLSLISSLENKILGAETVVFGELGLGAELRSVKDTGARLKEIIGHNFQRVIMPPLETKPQVGALKLTTYHNLTEVVDYLGWQ